MYLLLHVPERPPTYAVENVFPSLLINKKNIAEILTSDQKNN